MLTWLRLANFLSFKGPVEAQLQRLTVLLGPNNSGKSNFLAAPRLLAELAVRSLDDALAAIGHAGSRLPFQDGGSDLVEIEAGWETQGEGRSFDSAEFALGARVRPQRSAQIERECLSLVVGGKKNIAVRQPGSSQEPSAEMVVSVGPNIGIFHELNARGPFEHFVAEISDVKYFHFVPSALRAPAQLVPDPVLRADGAGLPAVLDFLRGEHPHAYRTVEEHLKACVPEIEELLLRTPDPGNKIILLKERQRRRPFDASEVSDGLLLFLALLCCIHTQPPASLICLEEPERGIHPRRLKQIVDLLYGLTEGRGGGPRTQIILTTHSPYFLDLFKDDLDAVLVLERTDEGTQVKRAKDVLDKIGGLHGSPLGEVWYSGVLGGVPQ